MRPSNPTPRSSHDLPTAGGEGPQAGADPRVAAFSRLVAAIDATDTPACLRAIRELRELGLSVCPVGAGRPRVGGR